MKELSIIIAAVGFAVLSSGAAQAQTSLPLLTTQAFVPFYPGPDCTMKVEARFSVYYNEVRLSTQLSDMPLWPSRDVETEYFPLITATRSIAVLRDRVRNIALSFCSNPAPGEEYDCRLGVRLVEVSDLDPPSPGTFFSLSLPRDIPCP